MSNKKDMASYVPSLKKKVIIYYYAMKMYNALRRFPSKFNQLIPSADIGLLYCLIFDHSFFRLHLSLSLTS